MMWNFITFHLKRMRERSQTASSNRVKFGLSGSMKKKGKGTDLLIKNPLIFRRNQYSSDRIPRTFFANGN